MKRKSWSLAIAILMMFFFTRHESPINGRAFLWQGTSCPYSEKSKFFFFSAAASAVTLGLK
jgi:hypothetical protein